MAMAARLFVRRMAAAAVPAAAKPAAAAAAKPAVAAAVKPAAAAAPKPAPAPAPAPMDFEDEMPASMAAEFAGSEVARAADMLPTTENVMGGPSSLGEVPLSTGDFHGISLAPFPEKVAATLLARLDPKDVEIKPDGMIYLPEIKYRRVLNLAFGPGGWGLMPRGNHSIESNNTLSREYALYAFGRFVAQARGEQQFFRGSSVATASEGVKSNALMRCCKDLGIASELWDPTYIIQWRKEHAVQVWVENQQRKAKQRLWRRKDRQFEYPFVEQPAK